MASILILTSLDPMQSNLFLKVNGELIKLQVAETSITVELMKYKEDESGS